uniref:Uncharacterized protein n=1 Tax=Glossina pallidipes TaxID=7398 RepID=A0A1A9ZMZ3_GLOPL
MDQLEILKHKRLEMFPREMHAEALKSTTTVSPVDGEGSAASDACYCASHNNAIDLDKTYTTSQVGPVRSASTSSFRMCDISIKTIILEAEFVGGNWPKIRIKTRVTNISTNWLPINNIGNVNLHKFMKVSVPPIDLLSVDLVELASPNPVVHNKCRDIYRDLALRKHKELMETRSPSSVGYSEAVKSSRLTTGASYGGSKPLTTSASSDTSTTAANSGGWRPSTVSASLDASPSVTSLTAPNGSHDDFIASVPSMGANEQGKEQMKDSVSTERCYQ